MKANKLLLLAVLAVAVSSCCNCGKSTVARKNLAGQWQVVRMDGSTFKTGEENYTLDFGPDNKVTGVGDCNRLNGSYTWDSETGRITVGPMASTRMMCPDQANESKFLRLLGEVDAYTIDGEMLMLFSNGEQKIVMERRGK